MSTTSLEQRPPDLQLNRPEKWNEIQHCGKKIPFGSRESLVLPAGPHDQLSISDCTWCCSIRISNEVWKAATTERSPVENLSGGNLPLYYDWSFLFVVEGSQSIGNKYTVRCQLTLWEETTGDISWRSADLHVVPLIVFKAATHPLGIAAPAAQQANVPTTWTTCLHEYKVL